MKDTEIWKEIPDYDNHLVSSLGRVKSKKYSPAKLIKQSKCFYGYRFVSITNTKTGLRKGVKVHKLVIMAFSSYDPSLVIDHINHGRTQLIKNLITHPFMRVFHGERIYQNGKRPSI